MVVSKLGSPSSNRVWVKL